MSAYIEGTVHLPTGERIPFKIGQSGAVTAAEPATDYVQAMSEGLCIFGLLEHNVTPVLFTKSEEKSAA